jgi:hypothetical protein
MWAAKVQENPVNTANKSQNHLESSIPTVGDIPWEQSQSTSRSQHFILGDDEYMPDCFSFQ